MFRPCIDIHNGKVKQIVGGTLNDSGDGLVENYVSEKEPAYYANLFKKDNLKGGHVIMLGEGNKDAAVNALSAYPNGLQIGGGINSNNAMFYLDNGASHVIVTSYVFQDGKINFDNLKKLVHTVKKDNLVLDLSCRIRDGKYYVVTDRWQKFTDFYLNKENISMLSEFCDEFLIHAVDVEGKKQGFDVNLVHNLLEWSDISFTYAGGIKSYDDINLLNNIGNKNLHYTIGSSLDIFGGELSYNEVVKLQNKYKKV
ncbi:MAG: phosphoribosylformimino-5-aminoimidazole carboxamide ribotide isomerase [Fusobacteria bacterium]|nr:phosphoribosylformimino-5-aminoimidazole carboxamide ribotide isomerase [Fusobacteriota bacterium]